MKNFAFAMAVLGVVALLAAGASAQATKTVPNPILVAKVDEMKTALKLTDEQVKKMTSLIEETEKNKKAMATEFEPVKAEYDKAEAANDQAAMKSAVEKWNALYKRQTETNTKASADIDSLLTTEQLTQWREHKYLAPILTPYKKLDLTDDQMAKIRVEFNRCMTEVKPDDTQSQALYHYQAKLSPIIQKEILTNEQREKLLLDPILAQYKAMNLTDAQIAKCKDQLVKLVRGAGPDDPMYMISMKLVRYIQKEVLTDEQREKVLLDSVLVQYKAMNLTDAQIAKIKDQLATLVKGAGPDDPMYMISMKLDNFIKRDVLSDEQREKLVMDLVLSWYTRAELTDEQVVKIKDKCKELLKEAKPSDQPWQTVTKINGFVDKNVLTDDQRAKMGIKASK